MLLKTPRAGTVRVANYGSGIKKLVGVGSYSRLEAKERKKVMTKAFCPELVLAASGLDVNATLGNLSDQQVAVAAIGGIGIVLVLGGLFIGQLISPGGVAGIPAGKIAEALQNKETILVDIRSKAEVNEMGSPSLKKLGARTVYLPYTKITREGEVIVENYGEQFSRLKGLKEDSVVILMDGNGRLSPQAAREVAQSVAVGEVCYATGGAAALQASGFPWKTKPEGISLPKVDLKGLDLDKIAETYKEKPTLVNTGLAVCALAAAGIFLFNEFDVILEAVGVLGAGNIFFRRFFFAKDREKTIGDLQSLNDKIAVKDAGDDLKKLASTILEVSEDEVSVEEGASAEEGTSAEEEEEEKAPPLRISPPGYIPPGMTSGQTSQ